MVILRKIVLLLLVVIVVGCGVKKPPQPLYAMPQDLFGNPTHLGDRVSPSVTPSPTPAEGANPNEQDPGTL